MKPINAFRLAIVVGVVVYALTASGCAACRQYPVACGVATAIVAGSIVATANSHSGSNADTRRGIGTPGCANNPALCK